MYSENATQVALVIAPYLGITLISFFILMPPCPSSASRRLSAAS